MAEAEDDDADLVFHVRLIIRHPTLDPSLISETLGLAPHLAGSAGSPRYTPKGRLTGTFRETVWSYSEQIRRSRQVAVALERIVGLLEPHAAFVSDITSSGGSVCLTLDLSGAENIGDVLPWLLLARLGALKIDLGAEVFPDLR